MQAYFVKPAPFVWPPIAGWHGAVNAVTEWTSIAEDFEHNPDDTHWAWLYLGHHPLFWEVQLSDSGDFPTLNWSNAWSRKRCLEHDMFRDDDGIWHGLIVSPVLWPSDTDADHRRFFEARSFEDLIRDAAIAVHESYGNGRNLLEENEEQIRKWK